MVVTLFIGGIEITLVLALVVLLIVGKYTYEKLKVLPNKYNSAKERIVKEDN